MVSSSLVHDHYWSLLETWILLLDFWCGQVWNGLRFTQIRYYLVTEMAVTLSLSSSFIFPDFIKRGKNKFLNSVLSKSEAIMFKRSNKGNLWKEDFFIQQWTPSSSVSRLKLESLETKMCIICCKCTIYVQKDWYTAKQLFINPDVTSFLQVRQKIIYQVWATLTR